MPKRIQIPAMLLMKERMWKLAFDLGSHEGQEELDPLTMTKWKYQAAKGGWTYQGSLNDVFRPTNTHAVIPDELDEDAATGQSVLPEDPVLSSLHRLEETSSRIEEQVGHSWNYTMLSIDGRVLKIGESREEGSTLEASLLKRYSGRKNGGPFQFVARQTGTRKTEQAAHAFLAKSGVKPIHGDEYYPSHEAIKALRTYGLWCLGPYAEEGGLLPAIKEIPPEPEQGSLDI